MCNTPEWLPEKTVVNPWTDGTFDMLYSIFERDIKNGDLKYRGYDVWFFCRQPDDFENGKEKVFWHLTSRKEEVSIPKRKRKFAKEILKKYEKERIPDLRRSERLPWVKPLIDNYAESEVCAWDYEEGDGDIHTYIWIKNFSFVVIMKKYRNGSRRLITSFYVDKQNKERDFERKYSERII